MDKYTLNVGFELVSPTNIYHIEKVLGQGTFGITYLASIKTTVEGPLGRITSKSYVAIKEFFMRDINDRDGSSVSGGSRDGLFEKYRRKFMSEAINLSKLRHQGIVRVVEAFEANNTYYYAMEYCEGGSLDTLIEKHSGLGLSQALGYFRQIASALEYMHNNRMLHLDLKPSNVMLRTPDEVVLIDFGLSKIYDQDGNPESSTTVGGGTPGYAPIEQANYRNSSDFPVTMDIYALGATLYKMLTGKRMPDASQILNDGFPAQELLSKGVSRDLVNIIDTAVSPARRLRYQRVADFVKAVNEVCAPLLSREDESTIIQKNITPSHTIGEPSFQSPQKAEPAQSIKTNDNKPTRSVRLMSKILLAIFGSAFLIFVTMIVFPNVTDEKDVDIETNGFIDTHKWVDLGLSVNWSTCNVGSAAPENSGMFFSWGELSSKDYYYIETSKTYNSIIGDIVGDVDSDAAAALWGSGWRLPTIEEINELESKCSWESEVVNGVWGYRVVGPNLNSIFMPASGGYCKDVRAMDNTFAGYWSGTEKDLECAYGLSISPKSHPYRTFTKSAYDYKYMGRLIRPVIDKK